MAIRWGAYKSRPAFDEVVKVAGRPHEYAKELCDYLRALSSDELEELRTSAELAIRSMGITFTVYSGDDQTIDREWPFDIIPRLIDYKTWDRVERGLRQRVRALNMFIGDLYADQQVIADGVFPKELLKSSANFRKQCIGVTPPHGVWANICGTDLVRGSEGQFLVLEDNLRIPSGVSYMLENRQVMKRILPELFDAYDVMRVSDYPARLLQMLASLSPRRVKRPEVVVLTPGVYNSAYFEHSYLAQQMGVELVEGRDLVVDRKDRVMMRTVNGLSRVDVIYRRVDDLFLDPEAFDSTSMLGVPGLMRAWHAGEVALANAPGAGVADDKVVYSYVPDLIEYYLNQKPIIPNVETYRCFVREEREYVLAHLDKLVVKPANQSGGYGMLIGPASTEAERRAMAGRIERNPREYIAQPLIVLSTVPTLVGTGAEPRHVDLRPFILSGADSYVTVGGLTRVALRKGSTVVNSSQGGGSKDTWIVRT